MPPGETVRPLGSKASWRWLVLSQVRYPSFPIPSCHAVIRDGDRTLLVQRAGEPNRGRWALPGGKVETGETLQAAVRREVLEETGLVIEPTRLVTMREIIDRDAGGRPEYHFLVFYFAAVVRGGELAAGDDSSQAIFLTAAEIAQRDTVPGLLSILSEVDTKTDSRHISGQ